MADPTSMIHEWNPEAGDDRHHLRRNSAISLEKRCRNFLSQCIRSIRNLLQSCGKESLEFEGPLLHIRNIVVMLFVLVSMSLDHIFLYVPLVNDNKKCIELDKRLGVTSVILRSIIDLFYVCYITSKLCPSSDCSWLYLIDILAVLPLPQVIILSHIPKMIVSRSFNVTDLLKFVILVQYIPRVSMIYPLLKKVTKVTMKSVGLAKVAWVKAAVDFFIYMLVSHVFGAFWYLFSIERVTKCWQRACKHYAGCTRQSFYCDNHSEDTAYITFSCPIEPPDATVFDFGIHLDALKTGVVSSRDFPGKLSYCFWWGLQNLSSLGQNLKTSTYFWENCFAVFVSIFGLAVFLLFIGNVQIYLQSKTMRLEEKRLELEESRLEEERKSKEKRKEIEQWLESFSLPHKLKFCIRQHLMNEWLYTGGVNLLVFTKEVNLKNLIHDLPLDLRKHTTRFLSRRLLRRVSMFRDVSDEILDVFCDHLQPVILDKDNYFVKEGEPLDKMIFIIHGTLQSYTSTGEIAESLSSASLSRGDFYGEELLRWVLNSPSSADLPASSSTIQASTNAEAFVLVAKDLKAVISKYWWHFAKKLGHSSASNLEKWRPLAASVIGSALLRHRKKKAKTLSMEEQISKRPETEQLTAFDMLPPNLKQQVKQYQQSSWDEFKGYDVGTLLRSLPMDLRRDVKRHLCLAPLKSVPLFMKMGDEWLDKLCDSLKPVHYAERSHIIRERDPIEEMVFIVQGKLWAYSTTSDKVEFFSEGCYYGEELVQWAQAGSKIKLPTAGITIQARSDVEAFTLIAGDLKLIVEQERMAKATSIIKAAYNRYKRKRDGHRKNEINIVNASETNVMETITDSQTTISSHDALEDSAECELKAKEVTAEKNEWIIFK